MMKWKMWKAGLCLGLASALLPLPAAAQFGAPTRPEVQLPGGPVRNVILDNCVSCHGIDDYAFHAMEREGWREFIRDIHDRDTVDGEVKLAAADEEVLLDYLAASFGPETIPFPRDYVPQEITEFFTDVDARVFMEANCASCHGVDVVLSQRHDLEGWRSLLVAERERMMDAGGRNAGISDENLEKLTEWLVRARGINLFE